MDEVKLTPGTDALYYMLTGVLRNKIKQERACSSRKDRIGLYLCFELFWKVDKGLSKVQMNKLKMTSE